MKVLIDTCVLSEMQRPAPDPRVRDQLRAIPPDDFFLSVITIGELVKGIERLPQGKRRRGLEVWLVQLTQVHAQRILPVDLETARIWGEIVARASQQGRVIPASDGLIAATALRHGLHVMTRNTADFQATGVLLVDPWATP
jgi:predicted nucleic acid-binding protein